MKFIAPLAVLALTGCQQSQTAVAEDCSALEAFSPTMAIRDARAAWERSDKRLLGVYGITTIFPGIGNSSLPVRMIEGTSDSDCMELNHRTSQYALVYNREMLRLADRP